MEMNAEKTDLKQLSQAQIVNRLKNVEYLNNLYILVQIMQDVQVKLNPGLPR